MFYVRKYRVEKRGLPKARLVLLGGGDPGWFFWSENRPTWPNRIS